VVNDCELAIWLASSVATKSLINSGKIEQHLEAWGSLISERTQHSIYALPLYPHRRHVIASMLFGHDKVSMHLAQLF
jgi:hypothetical protein